MAFDSIPAKASLKPTTFKAYASDEDYDAFKQLLKLSKIAPKTYENLRDDRYFGITRDWLSSAKDHWLTDYNWRKTEDRINSFPNYTVPIKNGDDTINVHFIALFSKKADAVPITLLHGWPGSILEFLSALDILRTKYTPETLPYHVVVPSLPGYGYSSGPPLDKDWKMMNIAQVVDSLMIGLGFGDGYISQGGDLGSFLSRILASTFPTCKTVHLNMCVGAPKPDDLPIEALSQTEQIGLARAQDFSTLGNAYAREHGTRPATVGLALSSSPLALLAWIGEKYQQWSDEDPPLDEILDSVTLYWFTDSYPRGIYPYREFFGANPENFHGGPKYHITKPFGYSYFSKELAPIPKPWVERTGNLVWYNEHQAGGHFAALEKPEPFVKDIEDFVKAVWSKASGANSDVSSELKGVAGMKI